METYQKSASDRWLLSFSAAVHPIYEKFFQFSQPPPTGIPCFPPAPLHPAAKGILLKGSCTHIFQGLPFHSEYGASSSTRPPRAIGSTQQPVWFLLPALCSSLLTVPPDAKTFPTCLTHPIASFSCLLTGRLSERSSASTPSPILWSLTLFHISSQHLPLHHILYIQWFI